MPEPPGRRRWVIAEGYIPAQSHGPGERDAQVTITIFFADREPAGPYRVTVPARRAKHLRFNQLKDPEPLPKDTDYASVIESDVPIVVQHTRLDSRQAALGLISTIAYAAD